MAGAGQCLTGTNETEVTGAKQEANLVPSRHSLRISALLSEFFFLLRTSHGLLPDPVPDEQRGNDGKADDVTDPSNVLPQAYRD